MQKFIENTTSGGITANECNLNSPIEHYFHFQASIRLFAQHYIYQQAFHLCELQAFDFDEFQLSKSTVVPF